MRRRSIAIIVLLSVIAAAVAGWMASSQISSPAEAAAATAAPEPSPILVPVESRVIASEIVTRGTGRFGAPQTLAVISSPLKTSSNVATWLPTVGDIANEGDVVARIDDRPIIALAGDIPMYRDLARGAEGRDVLQLEQALDRLGIDVGAIDGFFDGETERAMTELYQSHNADLLGPTPDEVSRLQAATADAEAKRLEALGQQGAVVATRSDVIAAEATLAVQQQAVADRIADRQNIEVPLDQAIINADAAYFLAIEARDNNYDFERTAELENAVRQRLLDIEAAREAKRVAIDEADRAVTAAIVERDASQRALAAARALLTDAQVLSSTLDARAEQGTPVETAMQSSLRSYVPSDEVVFLSSFPVRVNSIDSLVGAPVGDALSTVTNATVSIDSSLALNEADLVPVGTIVIIDEPNLGIAETGVVTRVDDVPGTMGVDGFHVYMEVTVDGAPERIAGSSVRLRLPVESSEGEVTAIPVAALSLAADGSSRVQVQRADGFEFEIVKVGLAADGYVELVDPGSLEPGDLVVVGFDRPAPAPNEAGT